MSERADGLAYRIREQTGGAVGVMVHRTYGRTGRR